MSRGKCTPKVLRNPYRDILTIYIASCVLSVYFCIFSVFMIQKHIDALLFIVQCIVGTLIGFWLYRLFPIMGLWSMLSIILVLAPTREDSMKLARVRIKANLVGAVTGLSLSFIQPFSLVVVCVGIVIAVLICEALKLQEAARSAVISVLIIAMHEPDLYLRDVAIERAIGVVLGCAIGIVLTYIFHYAFMKYKNAATAANNSRKGSEE